MPRPRDDPGLVEDERGEAGGRGAKHGVDDGGGHGHAVAVVGDAALERERKKICTQLVQGSIARLCFGFRKEILLVSHHGN